MFGWIILGAVLLFIAVLLVRAARFKAPAPSSQPAPAVDVAREQAVEHLAQMVQLATVSSNDWSQVDETQFEAFRALLRQLYPQVHAACSPERCGNTGLLFHWKGASAGEPVVLMAHYDVVPVNAERWQQPPFAGKIVDGELWGRGTLDTKITLLGVMESVESLLGKGFVPANDIYMAFAGDEEVAGGGAQAIVKTLKERGVKPAFVLDEGGAIVEKIFPGVSDPIAVVGIGEKGMADVHLSVQGCGGHASHPPKHTALGVLAKAIAACEAHPFKAQLTFPVRQLFLTVGPHAPFLYRLLFGNLWCFGGLLKAMAPALGSELNAMMRTTMSFNMASASKQSNIIPGEASAVANMRLINTSTLDSVKAHMEKAIHDPAVKVEVLHGQEASPYGDPACRQFGTMAEAIRHTWGQQVIVSPYLMIACSDSRHYSGLCQNVFKFSAMALSKEQRDLIHNDNERIPVEKIGECVEFYTRLIQYL